MLTCDYCDNTEEIIQVTKMLQLDSQAGYTGQETTICNDCWYAGIDLVHHEPRETVLHANNT